MLREKYGGEMIAVIGEEVVAHSADPFELRRMLKEGGWHNPFIEHLPPLDMEPPNLCITRLKLLAARA